MVGSPHADGLRRPGRGVPEQDVLGPPYDVETLPLPDDDEGAVVATLVHRPAAPEHDPTDRAVLHVHGFADYFFQTVAAEHWAARGYEFYAVDLRKHGRSLLPHQTANHVTDLATYYAELDAAWRRVRERHERVVLSAHSTGGLTVPLWMADNAVDAAGLVLNSPWLDMHGSAFTRLVAMPVIHRLGAMDPMRVIPRSVSGLYARSLHRDHEGEWDFDLAWKPLRSWPVHAGWLRAIRIGQARIASGLDLDIPTLTLCSTRSGHPRSIDDPLVRTADIVLDVRQIRRRAPMISRHSTVIQIDGAMHDVTLSPEPVRSRVFEEIDRFCEAYVG